MDKFDFPADDDDRKKTSATAAAVPSPPSFSPSAAAAPEKSVRMDADDDRKPRSREEMTEEADDFRGLMQALDE